MAGAAADEPESCALPPYVVARRITPVPAAVPPSPSDQTSRTTWCTRASNVAMRATTPPFTCACSSAAADALVLLLPPDADAGKAPTAAVYGSCNFQLKSVRNV